MQVALDFMDELQSSILQVKLNLSRDYEMQKLALSKSVQGQQEDIDALNKEIQVQQDEMVGLMDEMAKENETWIESQAKKTKELLAVFNNSKSDKLVGDDVVGLANSLEKDNEVQVFLKTSSASIKGLLQKITTLQTQLDKERGGNKGNGGEEDGRQKVATNAPPRPVADGTKKVSREDKKPAALDDTKLKSLEKSASKLLAEFNKKSAQATQDLVGGGGGGQGKKGVPIKQGAPFVEKGADKGKDGSKLKTRFDLKKPLSDNGDKGDKIDKEGVARNIGKIHGNIAKLLNGGPFKGNFMPNIKRINMIVQTDLKRSAKGEGQIKDDLDKTKMGVLKLKKKASSHFLSKLIFGGGPMGFLMIVVGGLILITLARAAWRKWKKENMPDPQQTEDGPTILGFRIPGVKFLKDLGIGIFNFVTVTLPIYMKKIGGFLKGVYNDLFGKKGCLRNSDMVVLTLKKIGLAWIIAHTKKVGGWIVALLGKLISLIPGFGPIASFLIEFAPMVYTFITTQIMLYWSSKKEEGIQQAETYSQKMRKQQRIAVKKLRKGLISYLSGIHSFVTPEAIPGLATPDWKPGDTKRVKPPRAAIWRESKKPKLEADDKGTSNETREKMRSIADKYYKTNTTTTKEKFEYVYSVNNGGNFGSSGGTWFGKFAKAMNTMEVNLFLEAWKWWTTGWKLDKGNPGGDWYALWLNSSGPEWKRKENVPQSRLDEIDQARTRNA